MGFFFQYCFFIIEDHSNFEILQPYYYKFYKHLNLKKSHQEVLELWRKPAICKDNLRNVKLSLPTHPNIKGQYSIGASRPLVCVSYWSALWVVCYITVLSNYHMLDVIFHMPVLYESTDW